MSYTYNNAVNQSKRYSDFLGRIANNNYRYPLQVDQENAIKYSISVLGNKLNKSLGHVTYHLKGGNLEKMEEVIRKLEGIDYNGIINKVTEIRTELKYLIDNILNKKISLEEAQKKLAELKRKNDDLQSLLPPSRERSLSLDTSEEEIKKVMSPKPFTPPNAPHVRPASVSPPLPSSLSTEGMAKEREVKTKTG
jgi:hypothetical protein